LADSHVAIPLSLAALMVFWMAFLLGGAKLQALGRRA